MRLRAPLLAAGLAAALVVPLGVTSSAASWNDSEWVSGSMQTTEFDCGTQTGYAVEAGSRQVGGTLLGQNLDGLASVAGIDLEVDGIGTETYSPDSAIDLDPSGDPQHTRAVSLAVGALGGLVGVSLPQITAGVPGLDVGALAQYARVDERGVALGATGLVADQSGVITIGETSAAPPEHSTISLNELLPVTSSISDVGLEIGAVSALAQVDGCDLLRESQWSIAAAEDAVVRDYEIAGLELVIDSPVLASLASTVVSTAATLQTDLNSLESDLTAGLNGALSQLSIDLAILSVSTAGTSVDVTAIPNVSDAVADLLAGFADDTDTIRLEPTDGRIVVDLAGILGGTNGLNSLGPNTELVLNDTVVNELTTRIGALLDSWTGEVVSTLETAVSGTHVDIDLSAAVRAQLALVQVQVATVTVDIDADLGDLQDGAAVEAGVSVNLLNLNVLGALLNPILAALDPLADTLAAVIVSLVGGLFDTVATLGTTLTSGLAPVVTDLGSVLAPLANVLSLWVNTQPDQPIPPGNITPEDLPDFEPRTDTSSGSYLVTALRVNLLGEQMLVTSVSLATARAGVVTLPTP
ncbi:choice-of-anchor G family protein [Microbacterium excoecariae]|uniref:choice-of-anchor G family protein n=1 Tax=Microbacterium excoecariae TaxID=2715210 RepID=UPI001408738B|nr:choice-of-anchor G family protein [Microbacterium excoecariae]NHI17810.1 choice-of-anchor G family protein [Microbacterium excoecariae]